MYIRPERLRKTLSNLRQGSFQADIKTGLDMNSGLLGNTNLIHLAVFGIPDSSVGIVTGRMAGVRFSVEARLFLCSETSTPALEPTEPLSSGAITPTAPYVFMTYCFIA
jgi:hypothetical protein